MGLETATTIEELNPDWPLGTDPKSQGDDHIRLIKAVLQADAVAKSVPGALTPTGAVMAYAATGQAPSGYLFCNGLEVSRDTYEALYAVIGDTFGAGDGSTTFNLPDLRGRVPAGYDEGNSQQRLTDAVAGITAGTLGAAGGDQRLHAHNHTYNRATDSTGYTLANGVNVTLNDMNYSTTNTGTKGTGGSENVQPTIVLSYIIKT